MQGLSTNYATVTRTATVTATNTIKETAYKTSKVTASVVTNYTAAQLDAIVSPSLFKNATATYTVMDKADTATEHRALKYALYLLLTASATVGVTKIWKAVRNPPLPAPQGVDRFK